MRQISILSSLLLLALLVSCSKENIDTIELEPISTQPDTVLVPDALKYVMPSGATTLLQGTAYKYVSATNNATLYMVASNEVDVECPGGLSASYQGPGNFFRFQFYEFNGNYTVFDAGFNTEIDGTTKTLMDLKIPECQPDPIEIEFEIVNDRMRGTFTGEFYYFAPILVEPLRDCVNYISSGIVEVSFDLPLRDCN
ncbi:MAG: hypothetical protein AAFV95_06150 [Bacteroidota bacterium]